jgi:dTDP-4-amino-4,6-dideoxygalactose transaminase
VWYHHINVGTNARMTEIQAAILSAQLERLEEQTLLRDKNGRWLDSQLNAIDGITVQRRSDRVNRRAYHLYCLQIDEAAFGCSREQMIKAAEAEGLEISAGYPLPLYDQPAIIEWYKNHDLPIPACPVVEDICQKSGAWMLHTVLLGSDEDMQDIVSIFQKIKAQAGELS